MKLLDAGLVLADDAGQNRRCVGRQRCAGTEIALRAGGARPAGGRCFGSVATPGASAVDAAHDAIGPDTIAKIPAESVDRNPKAVTTPSG